MRNDVIKAISDVCRDIFGEDVSVEVVRPDEQFGDWSTNVAMKLSKAVGQSPRDIAQKIASELNKKDIFNSVGIAGPGFINITIKDDMLIDAINQKPARSLSGLTVLVEYSDPNPFKPLHAGHLYTTLVGDVVSRLVEQAGAKTIRLNFGGDVGLHVAKSMWAIVENLQGEYPEKLNDIPENERANWMGARYVEGNEAYETDENAKVEIVETNKAVYKIHESGDKESGFAQIYWTCRQWSYDYFTELYRQLKVHDFDRFIPESEVTPLGYNTVLKELEKGVFEQSDGAVIFNGEKFGLHKRVFINSEGLPTYETKDVGLSLTKWQDYSYDESIIITDNGQAQYMQVVIKAIEQFEPDAAQRTKHITHGVLKMSGGEKMSSRKGNVLFALDLIEAARQAGNESGQATNEDTVLAALKYALVKNRIGGDVIYNPQESIAMEGNSGPYLQYAHARARSILKKSEIKPHLNTDSMDDSERKLCNKLGEYAETVELAIYELAPHHVCTYLYELAQSFNSFYEKTKVIGSEREEFRLGLVQKYADTLEQGLNLLGIVAPEQM